MSKASRSYYARVLGTFWRHPRTASLTLAACGAWVRCLSWCADTRSDGAMPAPMIPMILGGRDGQVEKRAIAELVEAGLLEPRADRHLVMRDWAQHNITFARHEELLDANRKRVAKSRSHAQQDAPVTEPVTHYTDRTAGVRPSLPSDQDQDQDQSRPSGRDVARAPEAAVRIPSPEPDPIEGALRTGYQVAYQREARDAWMTHVRDNEHIRRAAAWCRLQPNPIEAAERFLDGAFNYEPWRKHRWKWQYLAEDPGLTASRSTMPTGVMGDHTTLDAARASAMSAVPTMDLTHAEGEAW